MASGPGATLLAASSDGYILFRIIAEEAELFSLAVHPKSRKKGLGRAPAQEMLRFLEKNRVESLYLEVESTNLAAIRLYGGLGFVRQGIRSGYYGKKNDALIMKNVFVNQIYTQSVL